MVPPGGFGRSCERPALQYLPSAAHSGLGLAGQDLRCAESGEPRFETQDRRRQEMNLTRRHFLILLPAAAMAWEHVLAGTPEAAPNYNMAEHWWGMLVDIEKCIGCGSCVRACQKENNVPDGYYRTWIEHYRVVEVNGVETLHVES